MDGVNGSYEQYLGLSAEAIIQKKKELYAATAEDYQQAIKGKETLLTGRGYSYSDRFYSLKIFSNATIVPEKFLIESMKRYRTEVLLSDYRNEVPSQSFNFGKTLSILKRNKIHTFVFYPDARYWFDYGFGKQKNSKEDTVRIRENCIEGYPIYKCFEIRGSKLYYCSMAMSAFLVRNIDISKENHLDISKDHPAIKYANFCLGHEPESKMKSCRFCNGMEKEHIPCGKQVKND